MLFLLLETKAELRGFSLDLYACEVKAPAVVQPLTSRSTSENACRGLSETQYPPPEMLALAPSSACPAAWRDGEVLPGLTARALTRFPTLFHPVAGQWLDSGRLQLRRKSAL